jgi:hypothetical protein
MSAKARLVRMAMAMAIASSCANSESQHGGAGGSGTTDTGGSTGAAGQGTGGTLAGTGGASAGLGGAAGGGAGGSGTAGATGSAGTTGTAGRTGSAGSTGTAGSAGTAGTTGTSGGEFTGGSCTIPAMPSYASLPTNTRLPDPFLSMSGSRITTKDQWTCRRAEIKAQLENWELGAKPPKPSMVSGTVSNTSITVNAGNGTTSISFNASVSLPTAGKAPYPAIIGYIGGSLNATAVRNLGVAIINFNNDDLGAQTNASSRGMGKFYTLYGSTNKASSMIAWAWGVSRIMDVLEQTSNTVIDVKHVGVTGCSRDGKGALVAGAFDERIALTIPQESGSGGTATWRISDFQKSQGTNVQTLSEITGENDWFTASFAQFNNSASKLPFDHHMLMGMVAPRGLLAIDTTGIDWLTAPSSWGGEQAARMIYQALGGPSNLGASQVSHGDHCTFQASQQPEVDAFIKKFLLGQDVATDVNQTDGPAFDQTRWIDWTVPALQ